MSGQRMRPMTVGELSRRTGVPVKTLRECTDLGLIYTLGRSPASYRLFTADALWCVRWIDQLRGLADPVTVTRLAAQAGRTEDEIRTALAAMPDTEYDPDGRIIGFGLTFNPTPHRYETGGRTSTPGARWTPSPSPPSSATPPGWPPRAGQPGSRSASP